jgi:hypothetical protein
MPLEIEITTIPDNHNRKETLKRLKLSTSRTKGDEIFYKVPVRQNIHGINMPNFTLFVSFEMIYYNI